MDPHSDGSYASLSAGGTVSSSQGVSSFNPPAPSGTSSDASSAARCGNCDVARFFAISKSMRFLVAGIINTLIFIFSVTAMSTPWIKSSYADGTGNTATVNFGLNKFQSTNCIAATGACVDISTSSFGVQKSSGDFATFLLVLVTLWSIVAGAQSFHKFAQVHALHGFVIGTEAAAFLNRQYAAMAVAISASMFIFCWWTMPSVVPPGFAGGSTFSVTYVAGFACALMGVILSAAAFFNARAIWDEELAGGGGARNAGGAADAGGVPSHAAATIANLPGYPPQQQQAATGYAKDAGAGGDAHANELVLPSSDFSGGYQSGAGYQAGSA